MTSTLYEILTNICNYFKISIIFFLIYAGGIWGVIKNDDLKKLKN